MNYTVALQDPDWCQAMMDEYQALIRNHTWSLVELPHSTKSVGSKWVFHLKLKPNGNIGRYKALLVSQGYTQAHGIDYFDTFSRVVKPTSICVVLSLAITFDWPIRQLDISYTINNYVDLFMPLPHLIGIVRSTYFNISKYPLLMVFYWLNWYLSLTTYTDTDWASCPDDRHIISGFCTFLGNNLISWTSGK